MGAQIKVESNVAVIDGVERFTGADLVAPDLRAGAALVLAGLSAEGITTVDDIEFILLMAGLRGGCRFILKEYDIEKSLFGYVLPDRDFLRKNIRRHRRVRHNIRVKHPVIVR